MTKRELIAQLAQDCDLRQTAVKALLARLAELAESELLGSGEFDLPGIVKLKRKQRPARTGRNPATGEAMDIPAHPAVVASTAPSLKRAVAS